MAFPSSDQPLPLEANWIERPLALLVDGVLVAGIARANWGGVHVDLVSPVTRLSRGFDHRGWAFGLGCSYYSENRYAFRGQFTSRGVEAAENLLTDLFRDYVAIRAHENEVAAACRRTRQELADLTRDFEARKGPPYQERAALRRAFKAGGLTQTEYQPRLKGLRQEVDRIDYQRRDAERLAKERFAAWVKDRCGRAVWLDEAEHLLTEGAFVVTSVDSEQKQRG